MFDHKFAISLNNVSLTMYYAYMRDNGFVARQIDLLNHFMKKPDLFAKYAHANYSAQTLEKINITEHWGSMPPLTRQEQDAAIALAILENEN